MKIKILLLLVAGILAFTGPVFSQTWIRAGEIYGRESAMSLQTGSTESLTPCAAGFPFRNSVQLLEPCLNRALVSRLDKITRISYHWNQRRL